MSESSQESTGFPHRLDWDEGSAGTAYQYCRKCSRDYWPGDPEPQNDCPHPDWLPAR